ncbi:leucine-rich repeat domain-containing protein [Oceanihabitans sp. 2_MG-2023]|uniref:leucine-rich repeat domain-containing protein n=1 Tax=Oceanihabitans sp. 2_MG-2023 TaxID=3062661 RepID=UPI0026E3C1BA|nr:leucine-rich repeat domain-containing protein [Oceanihabitans sp. 2_MG-2023]MDO6595360.1 leucine-rich repeat domain-containing protein [Oceanihabitans sp. 2_MG-2023]
MKTKLLSLIAFIIAATSIAQTTFTIDGLNYSVTSTNPNEVSLTGGTPLTLDLVIPETVTDASITYTVVAIGDSAFESAGLTSVSLASTLRELGEVTFRFNALTEVTIPEGITSIPQRCFSNNDLTSVVLPTSLETIGFRSFESNNLTSLILPENIVSIGQFAFRGSNFDTITSLNPVPPSVVLGTNNDSFNNEQNTDLTIPTGTEAAYEAIGWVGFNSVNGVVDFEVGDTFSENNFDYEVIFLNPNEVELTGGTSIPQDLIIETLVSNGGNDFMVTSIGAIAIDGSLLTSITITATTPPMAVANAFGDNSAVALTIPDGTKVVYEAAGWTGFYSVNGILNFEVGDTFTQNNFNYEVISLNPNEVAITGGTTVPQNLIIAENVSSGGLDFVVTAIGDSAFIDSNVTSVSFSSTIRELGEQSFRNNLLIEVTIPEGITSIPQRCFSNNDLTSVVLPTSLETIGFRSFESNNLTSLILPENVVSIDELAFRGSNFSSITSLNTTPPSVFLGTNDDSFNNEQNIDLTIPPGTEADYEAAGWVGFNSVNGVVNFEVGDTFTENNFNYEVTSLNPNEVAITGGTTVSPNLIIVENVSSGGLDFVVTAIGDSAFISSSLTAITFPNTIRNIGISSFNGNNITTLSLPNSVTFIDRSAFRNNQLTSVTIPNSVITISNDAFRNNQLTSVIIPNSVTTLKILAFGDNQLTSITLGSSVTTIERGVFLNNPLATVTVLAANPPSTDTRGDGLNSFGNRSGIDLFVPEDGLTAYMNSGQWDGFKSVTGVDFDIVLAPKVFLQGAATNPNTGEEDLMRDDLRVAGLLPTTSPYADGLTVDATVFDTEGNDAIVDWISIELRDANNNTSIVASQSALLQRDGDVVDTDGVSPLSFNALTDNYFVVIKHRNHLGIMTANTFALSATVSSIDFTDANNPITFGTNAQTDSGMPTDVLGLWSGNVNGDTVVQYLGTEADSPNILSVVFNDTGNFLNFPTFTLNRYDVNDINMDGIIQYIGTTPDEPFILQNVLAHPGNFLNFTTFQIQEQLPEN